MSELEKGGDTAMPDLSAAIGKIMEHPELISMVASVLNESPAEPQKPSEEAQKTEVASDTQAPTADVMASLAPMLSRLSSLGTQGAKDIGLDPNHRQLLCALKPYLSDSRRNAIDYILKISQMSGLLKGLR